MLAAEQRYGRTGESSAEILARPAGLEETTICTLSGERAQPWCPSRSREWLPLGRSLEPCGWHHQSDEGLVTVYPAEYRAWSASAAALHAPVGRATFAAPPHRPAERATFVAALGAPAHRAGGSGPGALSIANPAEGTVYSIDPTLKAEFQALPLRVIASHPTSVTWLVDGAEIGTASSETALEWPLAAGTHQIEARDADGRRARTSVIVR
jgi:membrane carboxypeptidase/penicillin-binding protein PbpC